MASFEELLQCSVCLERFTSPKALPCLHTFCLSCLKGIIKDARTLDCPTCRKTHPVPEQGATGFLDNLVIVNLLDMVGESTTCSDCGTKQVLSQCEHCQQDVCADCRIAHNVLKAEISTLIDLIEKSIPEEADDDEKNSARSSLTKICEAETKVHKAYEEAVSAAISALNRKRDEDLHRIKTMAKFQKAVVEEEQALVIEEMRKELSSCQSIATLKEMKTSLSRVEEMFSTESLDLTEFAKFGEVSLGREISSCGVTSDVGIAAASSVVGDGRLASASVSNPPILASGVQTSERGLPSNVDYKAKQPLWKLVIATSAEGCEEFKPTRAMYSPMENAMYCLSNGKVLRYDAKSGVGKIACSIFEAKDMALADSGSLILIDDHHIVKITADRLENPKEETFTFVLANLPTGTKATRVCCYGREVIVLDSAQSCFLRFNEGGKVIDVIKQENLHLNEFSCMCMDSEGRIYVTSFVLRRQDGKRYHNQCYKEPTSVELSFECDILIVNMSGIVESAVGGLAIRQMRKTFNYATSQRACHFPDCSKQIHARIDKDSVRYNKILDCVEAARIQMICVDSDGYVSMTRVGRNQIDVYDPNGQHYCTIGGSRTSQFKEPTGLSLMPDGRLVVCDTGNERIQIV